MPKSAAERFTSKPLAFMANNVVLMAVNQLIPGDYPFRLTLEGGVRGRRLPRNPGEEDGQMDDTGQGYTLVDVYTLDIAPGGGPGTFQGYWLPYQANRQYHLELRKAADFMFTDRMDGCTFASSNIIQKRGGVVGLFSGTKKVGALVSHTNFQTQGGRIDTPTMNRAVLHTHGGSAKSVLRKGDYSDSTSPLHGPGESIKLTTFGVRKGAKWQFYYQQYETYFTGDYLLLGVKPV
jgi:hypothetical protein